MLSQVAGPGELRPGDMLGPYRLDALLGEGAMGLVFRATSGSERAVALKVLKRDLAGDLLFQHRFRQEARAAAEVRDPHLVPIIEAAEADGRHYIASGYASGGSLAERIAGGPLAEADAVRIVGEIGAGLDALHAAGIVHRDVKPSNVLFADDGTAMLTDFGLAKGRAYTALTRPGQVVGTLHYLAPELIRGEPGTPASDLYALACVAYECLVGRTPFAEKSFFEVGLAHLEEPPPDPAVARPGLAAALAAALVAPLAKAPELRPPSAASYTATLRAANEEPTAA
jgi:serine/threonine-protein kinase